MQELLTESGQRGLTLSEIVMGTGIPREVAFAFLEAQVKDGKLFKRVEKNSIYYSTKSV